MGVRFDGVQEEAAVGALPIEHKELSRKLGFLVDVADPLLHLVGQWFGVSKRSIGAVFKDGPLDLTRVPIGDVHFGMILGQSTGFSARSFAYSVLQYRKRFVTGTVPAGALHGELA